jgi:Zn finger protein HypA/HybF involved in hydrogenase expression
MDDPVVGWCDECQRLWYESDFDEDEDGSECPRCGDLLEDASEE